AADALSYVPRKAQELAQNEGTARLKRAVGADKPRAADPGREANQLAAEQSGYGDEAAHLTNPYADVPQSISEHGGYGAGILVRAGAEYVQNKALEKGIGAIADEFASLRGGGRAYGELDELGRPTGARATLTRETMAGGTRASQDIVPPGFEGGAAGQARGHLLGRQLGGSGTDARNLVTLYQNGPNTPVMRHFENQIRKAVEGGEVVNYKATPIYRGTDPVPVGVTMEAHGDRGLNLFLS